MPVLKIQETEGDSYQGEPEELQPVIPEDAYRAIQTCQPSVWGRNLFLAALAILMAAGGAFFYQKGEQPENPFVFFELRMTDHKGHPVPGAQVFWKKKHIGVSDSFGEWRRFMRVGLGERVRLDVKKLYGDREVASHRLFQVPFVTPRQGDIQMKAQVRLQGAEQPVEDLSPWDSTKSEETTSTLKPRWDRVWFTIQGSSFRKKLEPQLHRRVKELGLKIDKKSPWRVHVKVFKNNKDYLVRVESKHTESAQKFRFLKRVQKTPMATARKILFGLKQHIRFPYSVKRQGKQWKVQPAQYARQLFHVSAGQMLVNQKSESFLVKKHDVLEGQPCHGYEKCQLRTSNIIDWHKQNFPETFQLRLYGVKKPIHVFVSGYYAQHEKGKIWSYRGKPGHQVFVTIMDKETILYRGRVKNRSEKPAMISIRGASIARK